MKKGIELLRRETPEEKITRLENELIKERKGRSNDEIFYESEYKQLAEFTLEICDDGLCNGDQKVNLIKRSDKQLKHTVNLFKSTDKKVNINKSCITY